MVMVDYYFYTASSGTSLTALTAGDSEEIEAFGPDPIDLIGASVRDQHTNTALETDLLEGYDAAKITMGTWSNARQVDIPNGVDFWFPQSMPTVIDDNFSVSYLDTVGSLDAAVVVHVSHGGAVNRPYAGITTRMTLDTVDSGTSAGVVTAVGTITDLDPRKDYELIGGQLFHEDATGGPMFAKITWPTFNAQIYLPLMQGNSISGSIADVYQIPAGHRPVASGQSTITVQTVDAAAAEKVKVLTIWGELQDGGEPAGKVAITPPVSIRGVTGGRGLTSFTGTKTPGLGGTTGRNIFNLGKGLFGR